MLSPAFLDELRARTTLSTLVGQTVQIKRAGREWKGCCPFHNEKTPSFYVNDEKGFYHCFGCSAHGDAIRWMTDQRGLSFMDAVKDLAAAAGLEVPAADPQAAERAKTRDASLEINARARDFFLRTIRRDEIGDVVAAKEYLVKRGVSTRIMCKFDIGFAPDSRIGRGAPLKEALTGVDPKLLVELGLVKVSDSGTVYDFFRRRIIIPIHDARGGVIGFGGRIFGDGEPKYLNSPDTPVFDKGRSLFNIHRAAAPARAKGRLLIVEGYMDVIGLDSVGFDTAVAPNGTALTEHQLFQAWRLVDVPTVCFDADSAGRKAAARAAYRALAVLEPGKSLRFAFPPDGKDPDDLARESGLEAITKMVDDAIALVDVIWRDHTARFNMADPDQKAALSAEIRRILKDIRNSDVRDAYREAFLALFRGRGGQNRPENGRQSGGARSVSHAIEASLALGIVDYPGVIDAHAINVPRLAWRDEDILRLVTVVYDAGNALYGEKMARKMAVEAVEKAGLTDFVRDLRRKSLRLPFSTESDPERAETALAAALRENFTRGDRI